MAGVDYITMFAALGILVRGSLVVRDRVIRSQCRFLVAAALIPLTLNMFYVLSPEPLAYDPTALGFALCCLLFLFAVERRDLFVLEHVSLPEVLNADSDAVIIVSGDLRVLFANRAAKSLFAEGSLEPGAAVDTLLTDVAPSFVLSRSLGMPQEDVAREHRFLDGQGIERWIAVAVSPVYRGRGALAGHCLRLRDGTLLRQARAVRDEHASVLEAVVHGSGEGLLVQSASGEIRYLNEAFAAIWQLPLEMVRAWGKDIPLHVAKTLRDVPPQSFQQAWHFNVETFDGEYEGICDLMLSDGRIVEARTFPIDASQGINGRVWRLMDVTERRRDARAMIRSQKLEGLGVLAGGIAHDFNNLLVAILANAELARSEVPRHASAQVLLADVESAAMRASELTGQLLAYAGKTSFDREDLDLSSLVRDVSNLLMVSVPKGIQVGFDLAQDLPPVRAGAPEVRQIVMNLVTNAADAVGVDQGRISIETGWGKPPPVEFAEAVAVHGEPPQSGVYLRVLDTGIGMDPRTLERIFDPFFTTKFTGRGLGLAATLGILESHGGALRIETTLGTGTVFTLMLPVQNDALGSTSLERTGGDRVVVEGRNILVVDDEPSVRSVLAKALSVEGLVVSQASNGQEALSMLATRETFPDLVILDLTMPGLSGLETLERIREQAPDLPVLLSSGYPEEALRVLSEENSPRNGFIQKPYRKARLLEEIEKLLSHVLAAEVEAR